MRLIARALAGRTRRGAGRGEKCYSNKRRFAHYPVRTSVSILAAVSGSIRKLMASASR